MHKQATITSKGQITVPCEVRRAPGFEAGTNCCSRVTIKEYAFDQ
jgi:bifunctional DNA-binding transcriptional regulator/antitoxin component of YhaV-PrlF toxin-antitoxin module